MADNRFTGKAKLFARMAAIPPAVRQTVRLEINVQAAKLADDIRAEVPVDEGDLKDSVRSFDRTTPERIRAVVTEGSGGQEQKAHSVEFGRPGVEAQPHFFPTYRARKRRISSALSRAARNAIRSIWGAR